jgi:glycosyltransferase involved in cell wall biosynthesis
MQKVNVLYVITKLELGGAQKQLLSLIRHLDRARFSSFLFTAKDGLLVSEAALIEGLTLIKSESLERPINLWRDLLAIIEIFRCIKKNKITIVHTHSSKAGILGRLAAKLSGVKLILHTVHGWPFHDYQPGLARKLFLGLERFAAKFTDKIIVVSGYDKEKGIANRVTAKDGYALIHYGIVYADFTGDGRDVRKELKIGPDDLVVTNISCFKPQKSPLDFIRLAALVAPLFSQIKFLLVGNGVLRVKVERLIKKLNLEKQMVLTGWRRDIPEILAASDVLVLNSRWEGLPVVVLEALSSGCPVVATGGVAEVVLEGRTGCLVQPGDIFRMQEQLLALLKSADLRKEMGGSGRKMLGTDFSLEQMLESHHKLYADCLKTRHPAISDWPVFALRKGG